MHAEEPVGREGFAAFFESMRLQVYILVKLERCLAERVPSPANIADGPSRGDFRLLEVLQGVSVCPRCLAMAGVGRSRQVVIVP